MMHRKKWKNCFLLANRKHLVRLVQRKIPLVYALARMNYFRDNPESRPDILGKDSVDLCVRYEKNKSLIHYFDRWSVFDISKSSLPPVKVYLKKASEKHEETILWDVPIEPAN